MNGKRCSASMPKFAHLRGIPGCGLRNRGVERLISCIRVGKPPMPTGNYMILARLRLGATGACPGEVGSGSPMKDMRQHRNLRRFPREGAWSMTHYRWEAL